MKKILGLTLAGVVVLTIVVSGQTGLRDPAFLALLPRAGANLVITYDLRETWENASGADGAVVKGGDTGAIDFDNIDHAPKQGAQCMAFKGPSGSLTYAYTNLPSSGGTWFARGWFKTSNRSTLPRICTLSEIAMADYFRLICEADGKLWATHGTKSNVTAGVEMNTDQWYAWKIHWVKGAGTGIYKVWLGPNDSSLTLLIDKADGDANSDPMSMSWQAEPSVGVTNCWDDVRVKTTDF